jgi:hypothetical protein
LDEWVSEKRLDPGKVFFPKKIQASRPSSPIQGDVAPNLPIAIATSSAALKKKKHSLKRPYDEISVLPPTPAPSPGSVTGLGPATPIPIFIKVFKIDFRY